MIHFIGVIWGLWVSALQRRTLLIWTWSVWRTIIHRWYTFLTDQGRFALCLPKGLSSVSTVPALYLGGFTNFYYWNDHWIHMGCGKAHHFYFLSQQPSSQCMGSLLHLENVELSENTCAEGFENVRVNLEEKWQSKCMRSRNSGMCASNGCPLTCRNGGKFLT